MVTFEEVYRRHYGDVFRFVYSKVRDYNDALDLTSEVFLKALKGFKGFRGLSSVKTWLFSIAVNVVKDYWAYRNRHLPLLPAPYSDEADDLDNPLLASEGEYDDDEEETPDFAVPLSAFKRAYYSLPEPYREVLYLFYVEKMTYREIAEALGVSMGTVKSRLNRAKGKLKRLVKEEKNDP